MGRHPTRSIEGSSGDGEWHGPKVAEVSGGLGLHLLLDWQQVCATEHKRTIFALWRALHYLPVALLPQVPVSGTATMGRGAAVRPAQHQLLSRRLHRASRTQPAVFDQSNCLLRSVICGRLPGSTGGRRRPTTHGSGDWLPLHPAYLGLEPLSAAHSGPAPGLLALEGRDPLPTPKPAADTMLRSGTAPDAAAAFA